MKITSLKVYEGNNIKRIKRIIRVSIQDSCDSEIKKYLKAYFRISFLLGFKERFVDLEKNDDLYCLWVTYTQEEVSKYLLYNISYDLENAEKIIEKADNLVKQGFIYDLVKAFREKDLPVIEINEDLFQLGYGKNSIIVGKNFQSYENMVKVEMSRNRKTLWQCLRYSHIPKVDGKVLYSIEEIKEIESFKYPINLRSIDKTTDIKITISDKNELNRVLDNMMKMYTRAFVYSGTVKYRVICYKGEVGLIFKKENGYKVVEISDRSLEILEVVETLEKLKDFCKRIYCSIPIEFMYIDIQEDDELKAVDLGCVFDIEEELKDVKDKIIIWFIDSLIKEGIGLIPIFSVTGTNGKTTTARLIHHILKSLGFKSALTSTGGIYIDNKKIKNGDTTGFLSAREVLTNKNVETAVMETARGGIYKNGLGYEKAQVAVITSIAEDHIGMEGVKDLKDLINIKTIILEELNAQGKIIIKAQAELVDYIKGRPNICLYNINKNDIMVQHIYDGGEALYVEGDNIVFNCKGSEQILCNVKELPFTHNANSKGNILNIMAAIAAVLTIYNNTEEILKILKSLKCDLYFNPGRQNIIDMGDFKIILDYGHNGEAYNEVLRIAKSLNPSKLTGIIAAAGDRLDKYISELGSISAEYCDYIIIREQDELRGRKPGESARLIKEGILQKKIDTNNIKLIYKEEDAITYAMENAQKDEIIVLFTQCLDVIVPVINKFLEKQGKETVGDGIDFSH